MRREFHRQDKHVRLGLGRPLEIENPHSQVGRDGRWPSPLHRRPERTEAKLGAQRMTPPSDGGNVEAGLSHWQNGGR